MLGIDEPFIKDPNEVLDYQINWAVRLDGDTIATSTWLVSDPPGLTIESDAKVSTATTVWLSGGTVGTSYKLTNRVITAGARTMDQTIKFKIKER